MEIAPKGNEVRVDGSRMRGDAIVNRGRRSRLRQRGGDGERMNQTPVHAARLPLNRCSKVGDRSPAPARSG